MNEFIHDDFPTRVWPSLRMDEDATFDRSLVVERLDFFQQRGCRLADHAVTGFGSDGLRAYAREYARRGWIMQLHIAAQRHTSTRLRQLAGPAGGYATIGPTCDIPGLCRFLDDLEREGCLPRTIFCPPFNHERMKHERDSIHATKLPARCRRRRPGRRGRGVRPP